MNKKSKIIVGLLKNKGQWKNIVVNIWNNLNHYMVKGETDYGL